ncbi:MAG: hypothetical protein P8L39_08525 [Halioglobus sp.]|nr:hypothetical protein [Halioglobus sp.]
MVQQSKATNHLRSENLKAHSRTLTTTNSRSTATKPKVVEDDEEFQLLVVDEKHYSLVKKTEITDDEQLKIHSRL